MQQILIKGAKTHNLKNIDVAFPRNKFIVVTGVSGSGKSSLTIDTLYAEGQRKYIESLSSYARQFLDRMNKPDVDYIKGLCPAIAIEQKVSGATNRSTVGTMTEIFDYLRLMYARAGETFSPKSGSKVKKDEVSDVVDYILMQEKGKVFFIGYFIDLIKEPKVKLEKLILKGYSRLYIDGEFISIEDLIDDLSPLDKATDTYAVVQRFKVSEDITADFQSTVTDSVHLAFEDNEYECLIFNTEDNSSKKFNNKFEADGKLFEIPSPQFFNFNNSYGACQNCQGTGNILDIDENLVIQNKNLSVYEGVVQPWKGMKMKAYQDQFVKMADDNNFPIHKPYKELTESQVNLLWDGNDDTDGINQFFDMVKGNLYKIEYRILYSRYRGKTKCKECKESRIRKDASYVKINNKSIQELLSMSIWDLKAHLEEINLTPTQQKISERILLEINNRLQVMIDVGLGYLSLDRLANSLSGGESQRINLTRTLGSTLTDSLYILDEPSIGLHPRDTHNLIKVLKSLRDLNNTVIVVEHEEEVIKSSDYIVDIGPHAGINGGEIVYQGDYDKLTNVKENLTSQYLNGEKEVKRANTNSVFRKYLNISDADKFNLKNIDVKIPLNAITVVSGVSGSGKTTLIKGVLYPLVTRYLNNPAMNTYKENGDITSIKAVEMIAENPLGRSSRSNPVTYVKAFDNIRDLFAKQAAAKANVIQPKDFSFNVAGGRCETCKGDGVQVISMQFLADVSLTCEECKGKRFQNHVLNIEYRGKNIYDILEMSVDEAVEFFKNVKNIHDKISPLQEIGLGYLKLGQSSSTLSGGEAQRVKLASYLNTNLRTPHTLFIFDEPTTGLHFDDVQKLLTAMEKLVDKGHSVIIIEHNMDIIKNADYIIDLGPEGGDEGGNLVFQGLVKDLKNVKESYTAKFL